MCQPIESSHPAPYLTATFKWTKLRRQSCGREFQQRLAAPSEPVSIPCWRVAIRFFGSAAAGDKLWPLPGGQKKDIMNTLDFKAEAALYLGSDWQTALNQGARTFSSAAKAIRFAMEEVPPVSLRGALMVVDGRSYSPLELRSLYRNRTYPLLRKQERVARIVEPSEE